MIKTFEITNDQASSRHAVLTEDDEKMERVRRVELTLDANSNVRVKYFYVDKDGGDRVIDYIVEKLELRMETVDFQE